MRVNHEPVSPAANRCARRGDQRRPLYEHSGGQVVRARVLAIANGLVVPRPFWELLQRLAVRREWLRGTFALASGPTCYGVVRADAAPPVPGFCGTWQSPPRLTLLVAGKGITENAIEAAVRACRFAERPLR